MRDRLDRTSRGPGCRSRASRTFARVPGRMEPRNHAGFPHCPQRTRRSRVRRPPSAHTGACQFALTDAENCWNSNEKWRPFREGAALPCAAPAGPALAGPAERVSEGAETVRPVARPPIAVCETRIMARTGGVWKSVPSARRPAAARLVPRLRRVHVR